MKNPFVKIGWQWVNMNYVVFFHASDSDPQKTALHFRDEVTRTYSIDPEDLYTILRHRAGGHNDKEE